jgi:hypothetical protein
VGVGLPLLVDGPFAPAVISRVRAALVAASLASRHGRVHDGETLEVVSLTGPCVGRFDHCRSAAVDAHKVAGRHERADELHRPQPAASPGLAQAVAKAEPIDKAINRRPGAGVLVFVAACRPPPAGRLR